MVAPRLDVADMTLLRLSAPARLGGAALLCAVLWACTLAVIG